MYTNFINPACGRDDWIWTSYLSLIRRVRLPLRLHLYIGADKENRTPNLCITSAMLCQIELCQQNGRGYKNRTYVCESQSLMPCHLANPLKQERKNGKPFLLSTKVQRYLQGLDISFCFLNTHVSYFGIIAMLVVFIAQRFPNLFSHNITSWFDLFIVYHRLIKMSSLRKNIFINFLLTDTWQK